ncbi:hypothetical protein DNH61_08855 [Paenibacillus sambharensis]|uniref:GGDEF domain-containing protein n=1 Tax=Paenibacillus sambharensis TaxID=1803190 RepID=A0A2W1LN31_9BACL|nr:hypothetical protein [Paenibacillus sambharensis]PZD96295.1 hypothetical protein DNH61_08855 [Paenibacillus sambharensis]
MKRERLIVWLFILTVGAAVALVASAKGEELLTFSAIVVLSAVCFAYLKPLQSFALLVVEMLGTGFWLAFQGYMNEWDSSEQAHAILTNLAFMACVICLWLTVSQLVKYGQAYSEMNEELQELRKYEKDASVLTINEFMYRMESIFVAMRRRKEQGYLLKIKINAAGKEFAKKSVFHAFATAALKSVREQYDLVGKVSDYELVVLLQNTNRDGASIVEERFKAYLHQEVNVPESFYETSLLELPDNWSDTQAIVA